LLSFVSEAALERQKLFLEYRLWQPTKQGETRQSVALIKLGRLCRACNEKQSRKKKEEEKREKETSLTMWFYVLVCHSTPSL